MRVIFGRDLAKLALWGKVDPNSPGTRGPRTRRRTEDGYAQRFATAPTRP